MFNLLLLLFLNYARYKRGAAYEQVVDYYTKGNAGIAQECAVELALQDYPKCGFTIEQIMYSIRKAMKTKTKFGMSYITNESAIGPTGKESRWVLEP